MIGVGREVARVLLGDSAPLLTPFRFERFATGDLHPVSNSPVSLVVGRATRVSRRPRRQHRAAGDGCRQPRQSDAERDQARDDDPVPAPLLPGERRARTPRARRGCSRC